ncbi:hypothetical protein [uncultured Jatrophihabitans sp.]|uniref:hypothetical protein n=1 Tax=uncultured Jatrophihabitans sp. TaxID=1610747 RepID=UPI0035CBCCAA
MPSESRPTLDVLGLILLLAGVVATAVSFVTLHWYSVDSGADSAGDGFTFGDLHGNADQLSAPVAASYFDRLAWGLVAVTVLLALAARVPSPMAGLLRLLGFLAGVVGIALTYYALAQLFDAQRVAGAGAHGVLHNAGSGLWSAYAGYALLALGAVVAPSPARAARRQDTERTDTADRSDTAERSDTIV